ncbi:MAG: nuclear transport factor 2 family protein [Steroidobacteraceae bacterium]
MRSGIDVVREFYEATGGGDISRALSLLSPSVRWTEMQGSTYAGTYQGPQAVLEGVFARIGSEWEGFRFDPDRLIDAGNSVVATGWYSGVYRATGRNLRCRTLHVWDVSAGQVNAFEQFCDTLTMSRVTA